MEPLKNSDKIYKPISEFFQRWNIDPERGILIAASGGIDSTALMALLAQYRNSYRRDLVLHALYVNHNLRSEKEIEDDWKELSIAAEACDVPLHRADVPEGSIQRSALELHEGIESAARNERYRALETWAKTLDLAYIALGHTLDDLVETMIMRFLQGCGVSGLHGIPPVMGNRIRPLLEIRKVELYQLVKELGLPFSEDSSNGEDWYLRNRIRSGIIPILEKEFPSLVRSLKESSMYFIQEEEILQQEAQKRIPWLRGEKRAETDFFSFAAAPEALRVRSLLALIHHYLPGAERIPRDFLALKRLSGYRKEATLLRGHGFTLRKVDTRLFFTPSVVFPRKTRYVKRIFPGSDGSFGNNSYTWGNLQSGTENWTAIALPESSREKKIFLRSRRLSDSIRTSGGTKRLKDVYRELGVPEDSRDEIPVLQIGEEIFAVFGSLFGYQDVLAVDVQDFRSLQTGIILSIQRMETWIGR